MSANESAAGLRQADITALVAAAKAGRIPEPQAPPRRRLARTVDFSQTSKFTVEQQRRLRRALSAFCAAASTRLWAELRVPVDLSLLAVEELTWSGAHGKVPPASIAAVVEAPRIGTRMLLSAERDFVLGVVELLLGGSSAASGRGRRLTEIDWSIARYFADRLVAQLSAIWTDLAGVELRVERLDAHIETAQLVAVSEPTLALTIEARLQQSSWTLSLLVPRSSLAPIEEHLLPADHGPAASDKQRAALRAAVGGVDVEVRAEVAAVELPIEQVLALRPGDLLRFPAPAATVTLFAGDVPVHRAQPGRAGTRRAVQLLGAPAR